MAKVCLVVWGQSFISTFLVSPKYNRSKLFFQSNFWKDALDTTTTTTDDEAATSRQRPHHHRKQQKKYHKVSGAPLAPSSGLGSRPNSRHSRHINRRSASCRRAIEQPQRPMTTSSFNIMSMSMIGKRDQIRQHVSHNYFTVRCAYA